MQHYCNLSVENIWKLSRHCRIIAMSTQKQSNTKMENNQKTDLQAANESLVELRPNVTSTDRKEAPMSESMVIMYLKGEGKDLESAVKLLQFFRQKIEDRRKIISEA